MIITKYKDILTGQEFNSLPKIHRNMSPITASNFHLAGLEKVIVEVSDPSPEPSPEPTALYAKEKAFVAALLQYAAAFQIDLASLDPINITTMLTAAHTAGVPEAAIAAATAILLALTRDIEAEAKKRWGYCWDGLKERFQGYVAEIMVQG